MVYSQKPGRPYALVYKLTDPDMGIALCHYALACRHAGRAFVFQGKKGRSDQKGYELFGEITLHP